MNILMAFNLQKKIGIPFILVMFLAASCKKNSESESTMDSGQNSSNEIQQQSNFRQKPDTHLGSSDSPDPKRIDHNDRQELIKRSNFIIEHGDRTPGSADAKELQGMITDFLRRGDPVAYEIISKLPPGYYSEAIVKGVFLNLGIDSIDGITDLTSPIAQSDMHRAAISAACSAFVLASKRMPDPPPVTKAQAYSLRESGLPKSEYDLLLVYGLRVGSITPEEVLQDITSDNNTLLSQALMNAPIDTSKNLLIQAINNEKPVDMGSVKNFALRLQRENPVQAVEWYLGLRHDKFGAAGVESIVREWLAADPIAASSFVGTMSPGPEKDAAVSSVVRDCVKNGDYETGSKWLEQIHSERLRGELLNSLSEMK